MYEPRNLEFGSPSSDWGLTGGVQEPLSPPGGLWGTAHPGWQGTAQERHVMCMHSRSGSPRASSPAA